MMAAPMTAGHGGLLEEAIAGGCAQKLCKANDYVVAIMSEQRNFVVKVVKVNKEGNGIMPIADDNLSAGAGPNMEPCAGLASYPNFATPPTSPKFC